MGLTHEQDDLRRQLKVAGEELALSQAGVELARDTVDLLVIAALKAGIAPGEVGLLVPLSRETIRILARLAGLPPAPRGGAPMTHPSRAEEIES